MDAEDRWIDGDWRWMWSSCAGKRAAAAAHEEADLDGMQNGQVAEGGRIGMGLGMRGARGRRTSSRAGQDREWQGRLPTGQGRTGQNIPYCRYAVAIGTDQARGFCRSAVTG